MSAESNKAAILRFSKAINSGNLPAALEEFAPNAVVHMGSAPTPLDRESFKQMVTAILAAFSEGTSTIEDIVAVSDRVVTRLVFRAKHTGDLMGLPATNRSVEIAEVLIDRFADGKIVESWRLFDQMAMMQQLGAV